VTNIAEIGAVLRAGMQCGSYLLEPKKLLQEGRIGGTTAA
jgi:hypothetical protein